MVFADDANTAAREKLAEGLYRAGLSVRGRHHWRNIYLTGAQELLRNGPFALPPAGSSAPDVLTATTTTMLLDLASVRVNPDKAAGLAFKINIELTDRAETHLITVEHGVLVHEAGVNDPGRQRHRAHETPGPADDPDRRLCPFQPRIDSGDIVIEGDASALRRLGGSDRSAGAELCGGDALTFAAHRQHG